MKNIITFFFITVLFCCHFSSCKKTAPNPKQSIHIITNTSKNVSIINEYKKANSTFYSDLSFIKINGLIGNELHVDKNYFGILKFSNKSFSSKYAFQSLINNINVFSPNKLTEAQNWPNLNSIILLNDTISTFTEVEDLKADKISYNCDTTTDLTLHHVRAKSFSFINLYLRKNKFPIIEIDDQDFDNENLEDHYLNDNINNTLDTLFVTGKTIHSINVAGIKNVVISQCHYFSDANFYSDTVNSITMDSLKCMDEKCHINLNFSKKHKTMLILKQVDVSSFDFDYSKSHFSYFPITAYDNDLNAWKSDVIKIYHGIIASQTRLNNQQGIQDASIEMGKFEDQQIPWIGKLIVLIKTWWNDYGFEKEKVVGSSSLLFLVFVCLNFLIFTKLLEIYPLPEISKAREYSFSIKTRVLQGTYRFFLCAFYSGIIFYGLKFDVSSMRVRNLGWSLYLIVQYLLGIVSLAYIANLIITK